MPVVERFLGILALVAAAMTVFALVQLVTGRRTPWLVDAALPLAAAIAAVATAGSLAMSEIAGYPPCVLCWYQRIAMYPLTIVLAVGAVRRDRSTWLTAMPIAAAGAFVAAWHVAVERRPVLGGVCDPAAPCAVRWVEEFGFLTLPAMALIGFVAIGVLTLVARHQPRDEPATDVSQLRQEA